MSRYEKFRHSPPRSSAGPIPKQDERRLGKRFSELVLDEVLACPFVPGAQALLERRAGELPRSSRPAPLRGSCGRSPRRAGGRLLRRDLWHTADEGRDHRPDPGRDGARARRRGDDGDARTDLDGAQTAGIRFIGRVRPGDRDPFSDDAVPVVSDLAELDRRWDELLGGRHARSAASGAAGGAARVRAAGSYVGDDPTFELAGPERVATADVTMAMRASCAVRTSTRSGAFGAERSPGGGRATSRPSIPTRACSRGWRTGGRPQLRKTAR